MPHTIKLDDLNVGAIHILDRDGNLRFLVHVENGFDKLRLVANARDHLGCPLRPTHVDSLNADLLPEEEE